MRNYLEALVIEDEIRKVSLIFPELPNTSEVVKRWLEFTNDNKDDIIDGYANPSSEGLSTSGEQPFHCVMYFRPEKEATIKDMIKYMEELKGQRKDALDPFSAPLQKDK